MWLSRVGAPSISNVRTRRRRIISFTEDKNPRVFVEQGAVWALEEIWTLWDRDIYLLGLLDPADRGCTIPRNVINYLSFDTANCPRRPGPSATPAWGRQSSKCNSKQVSSTVLDIFTLVHKTASTKICINPDSLCKSCISFCILSLRITFRVSKADILICNKKKELETWRVKAVDDRSIMRPLCGVWEMD